MGGFFVTSDARSLQVGSQHFATLGHEQAKAKFGSYEAVLAKKKLVRAADHFLELTDGRIAGAGVWFTESAFGQDALGEIAENLRSTGKLGDLAGHYNFLVEVNGDAYLYADKSGTLPVYAARHEGNAQYSTSFLALASAAASLTFSTQEVLEYVNVEATLGNRSVFEEIEFVPFGTRVSLKPGAQTFEKVEDFAERPASYEAVVELLAEHFRRLNAFNAKYPHGISCELSGGLDSRNVAALLHYCDVPHVLNTNVNRADPADHETALNAAMALGRSIVLHSYPESQAKGLDIEEVLTGLDMARDAFRSKRNLHYFEAKSTLHPLVLGGYGGELVRSVYSIGTNPAAIAAQRYCRNVALPPRDRQDYLAQVEQKFRKTLEYVGGNVEERASEKIYFFEKMRSWGGSRIAAHNRFGYNYHPLLDLRVQKLLLSYPIADKEHQALQKRLIALDSALAAQPYVSGGKAGGFAQLLRKSKLARRLTQVLNSPVKPAPTFDAEVRDLAEPIRAFAAGTGVPFELCTNESARGRYLTLVRLYRRYREKSRFGGIR